MKLKTLDFLVWLVVFGLNQIFRERGVTASYSLLLRSKEDYQIIQAVLPNQELNQERGRGFPDDINYEQAPHA